MAYPVSPSLKPPGSLRGWQYWLSSPVFALLFPVTYVFLLFITQAVSFARPVATSSIAYFALVVVLIAGSAWIGMRHESRESRISNADLCAETSSTISGVYFGLICLLGFLALVFSIVDILWTTPLITLLNPVEMRASFGARETSLWAYPADILLPFSNIAFALTVVYFKVLAKPLRWIGIFVGSTPTVLGLLLAGRLGMILQAAFCFYWMLQRPIWGGRKSERHSKGAMYLSLAIGIGIVSAAALLSQARSGSEAQASQVVSLGEDTVTIHRDLLPVLDAQNPVVATGLAEALLYWTSPLVYFDEVYRSWNMDPDLIGVFSPVLQRRLSALGLSPSGEEAWQHWCDMFSGTGLQPNSWGTLVAGFVRSFGRFGTLIVSTVLGYWLGRLFVRGRVRRSFTCLYLSSVFFVFLFAFLQFSVFINNPTYEWSLIGIVLWRPVVKRAIAPRQVVPWVNGLQNA